MTIEHPNAINLPHITQVETTATHYTNMHHQQLDNGLTVTTTVTISDTDPLARLTDHNYAVGRGYDRDALAAIHMATEAYWNNIMTRIAEVEAHRQNA